MADEFDQSKTEAPTQRRRDEAREQGQVASSRDLTSSLALLAGFLALALAAGTVGTTLIQEVRHYFAQASHPISFGHESARQLMTAALRTALELLGLLLGVILAVALGANVFQVGFQLSPAALGIQWERLSPMRGWARIASMNSGIQAVATLLKLSAMAAIAYFLVRGRLAELTALRDCRLAAAVALLWATVIRLGLAVAGALAALGVADYGWQWWRNEQSLRMSRQELKEDLKRDEGDPQFKARVRKLQRQAAQKRMLQAVPSATVVLTNPTHLAVALQYDRTSMPAPRVVAKGAGFVAKRIAEIARKHGVPVLERKPVAQGLFKAVKVGQEIPAALYHVVAEILAYVYRMSAK
jgi:flagellar biosynthesis protein FlhB